MTKTIFRYTFMIGLLVLLLCGVLFFGMQYRSSQEVAFDTLRQDTIYAQSGLKLGGKTYLESLENINRITWIDKDGTVLFDSEVQGGQANQSQYPEVAQAFSEGEGTGIRKSISKGVRTMYYARLLEDGTVLRLSTPFSAARMAFEAVSPVLWVLVLVVMISGTLAFRAANKIVAPINALDLDKPEAAKYPELTPLIGRLKEQNLTIQLQMAELSRKQQEFEALTDNMSEGFVLLDKRGRMVSANHCATKLVPALKVGEKISEYVAEAGKEAIEKALEGVRTSVRLDRDGQNWEMIGSPVVVDEEVSGAALLFMDITEREQRERLRQEFSANVSHELKTPLTSISGFAELMMEGAVPEEKMKEFSGDIYRESQRLISLVEDTIKLSKLDEEAAPMPFESVDLLELSEDVSHSLNQAAEKKAVRLEVVGTSTRVNGVWQVLHEMVYNLVDNAIKYNVNGGTVTVTVDETQEGPFVKVTDTGIGIPLRDQPRVFERFYRVDKSHSKEIGGTGLGLSIVKHGAQLHGAQVDLLSEENKGTEITIRFPLQIQPEEEDEPSLEQA